MRGRDAALAAMAALAAFLVVGVVVTEASAAAVEFSLFLGIPAGVLAGAIVFAVVYRGLGAPGGASRRLALGLAAFGTVFLLLLVLAAGGLGVRNSVALVVAVAGGAIAGAASFLRLRA